MKKWLGQVVFTLTSTGGSTFNYTGNYGYAKYEDFDDRDFTVDRFECVGMAGASTTIDIELLHHELVGWTYHASAFVPGADVVVKMSTDYSSETGVTANKPFAYKRIGIAHDVSGSSADGVLIRITAGANNTVDHMTCHIDAEIF